MDKNRQEQLRSQLLQKKHELAERLERIHRNLLRTLEPDSSERAKQLEDRDVVEALGKEARLEMLQIAATLRKMADDVYGVCAGCGRKINDARLEAYPYASECIDCATLEESAGARR